MIFPIVNWLIDVVVPHAGTWIEIFHVLAMYTAPMSFPTRERGLKSDVVVAIDALAAVVPHAGTWIEINIQKEYNNTVRRSFPTRERGLKSLNKIEYLEARGRSPRGNVD